MKTKAVKSFKAVISVIIVVSIFITSCIVSTATASGFYVSGTSIMDANGNQFVMRGVNIAHAWYADKTEQSIEAAADLGANTVRIVLSDGGKYTKTSYSEVSDIIECCKRNKVVCVLEVHDATGSDSVSDLNRAVSYWIELKNLLAANESYVIVNIANEWYGSWDDASNWAQGYKSAISSLRSAGINNMLMIDAAGWGQYPAAIHNRGAEVFNSDPEKNTVFSIHMYEYAGGNASDIKKNIDGVLSLGVPVVIGEFGNYHSNGDVDEATIMEYCTQKRCGYLGWSWKGNSGGVEYLDIANSWDGSSLSDWGNTLFYGANGISSTASVCSVFNGTAPETTTPAPETSSPETTAPTPDDPDESDYISLFYGSASSSSWGQAVSVMTAKNGGAFDASNIKAGGHFYVEYKGEKDKVELILQSWSGGSSWGKVEISESGIANGNYFAKFSYENCADALGSGDFAGKLDQIHIGAQDCGIEVISVCYDFGD